MRTAPNLAASLAALAASIMFLLAGAAAADDDRAVANVTAGAPQPGDWRSLGVGRLAPALEGTALDGTKWTLADIGAAKATVLAMTSATCPVSQKYAPVLARLEEQWRERGVQFVFINASSVEKPDDMRSHAKASDFRGPYLRDADQHLAAALQTRTTGEVIVLDAARTIVYRGAIDDQYGLGYAIESPRTNYLIDALTATLKGEQPAIRATTAPGCVIDLPPPTGAASGPATATVTYHNRISRIVQNNCLACHRAGGIAPFGLEEYKDVAARAGMLAQVVERGVMPPWFAAAPADAHAASPWRNDRSLTPEDKADFIAWLRSADHAEGDAHDAPLQATFPATWTIGEPDVVLQLPEPQAVKAEGVMPYIHVRVDTNFDDDRWVQAIEIEPTARSVVHHVLVFAVPEDALKERARDRIREAIDGARGFFAAYVPGSNGVTYPDGFAKLLPKHSTLIFQLHYTPNGTATSDQTRIAIRFAKKPPEHEVRVVGIANRRISIPPNDASHEEHAAIPVLFDAHVLAFMPHMHVRGKAFHYEASLPDGSTLQLLDVPRYDFNWQLRYEARQPIALPKGSRINVTGWYDNSSSNAANPDPSATVTWGPQTFNEMMLGYIEYYRDGER